MDKQFNDDDLIWEDRLFVEDEIETYYVRESTPIGNSAKVGVPKEHRGQEGARG